MRNHLSSVAAAGKLMTHRSSRCVWRSLIITVLFSFAGLGVFASVAGAAAPAPGWEVMGRFGPTELHPGGYALLHLYVFNSGAGSVLGAPPVLVDKLPRGLEAVSSMPAGPEGEETAESAGCSGVNEVTCELGGIEPLEKPSIVLIPVRVLPEAQPQPGETPPVIWCR